MLPTKQSPFYLVHGVPIDLMFLKNSNLLLSKQKRTIDPQDKSFSDVTTPYRPASAAPRLPGFPEVSIIRHPKEGILW